LCVEAVDCQYYGELLSMTRRYKAGSIHGYDSVYDSEEFVQLHPLEKLHSQADVFDITEFDTQGNVVMCNSDSSLPVIMLYYSIIMPQCRDVHVPAEWKPYITLIEDERSKVRELMDCHSQILPMSELNERLRAIHLDYKTRLASLISAS